MKEPLKFLAAATVERLATDLEKNLLRYQSGNFADLEKESGWAIETSIARWDPNIAGELDPSKGPEAEIRNSLIIYHGLEGMTPALAREERLWARLCHVECLEFARKRWLGAEDDVSKIRSHFFAAGLTGCRDDNAIGRLWWNGHIAALACPEDVELGLGRLLARANIRLQVIDRADTAFRQPLISGICRLLGADNWFNSYDAAIADFMFEVNMRSGGLIFEALSPEAVDKHLMECLSVAKARRAELAKIAA